MKTAVKTATKTAKVVKKTRGRPSTIAPIIKRNIIHLAHNTPKEFVERIFGEAQKVMKGGVTDDPVIVKAQRTCLYQTVLKEHKKALGAGKKVAFKGRKVGDTIKFKWVHGLKAAPSTDIVSSN